MKNKLKDFGIRFFGNRLTLAGALIFLDGLTYCFLDTINLEDSLYPPMYLINLSFGAQLLAGTMFGRSTYDYYKRTIEHIVKNDGKFDERYLKVVFKKSGKVCGYCEEQGMYLAAREKCLVSKFREAQKKYSKNIIHKF